MLSKRSFFKRLTVFAVTLALAPQIAFKAELNVQPKLNLDELFDTMYALMRARKEAYKSEEIMILTDAKGAALWNREFPNAMIRYVKEHPACVGVYEQLRQSESYGS